MLWNFPQDLFMCVLNEWLAADLKTLSQLDVAIGCSAQHWLSLLADLRLGSCKLPLCISLLAWMHARRLQITEIVVKMAAVNSLDGQALPFTFTSITAVVFGSPSFDGSPFGLKELLAMLPNVSSITFTGCAVDDHHLLELPGLPLPRLRELNLQGDGSDTTPAAVTAVAKHFSATLEVLRCDMLDDRALQTLSRSCRALTVIEWSLEGLRSAHYLLELCAHNTQLAIMKLWSCTVARSKIVTNSFVTRLSLVCPLLQEIWLDPMDLSDYLALPALLAHCKLLSTAAVRDVRLSLHSCRDGNRFCDVYSAVWHPQAVEHAIDLLCVIALPVRCFGWMEDEDDPEDRFEYATVKHLPVNRQALCLLVEHARTLEDIRIDLDVEPEDLQHLLRSCANLTVLKLCDCNHRSIFDDRTIRRLPSQCPRLVALELRCCAMHVCSQAVVDVLLGYRNNDIICLKFTDCLLLADAVLDAMDEHFPKLRQVSVSLTSVTKERALAFVIKRRFSPLSAFGAPSHDSQEWLEQQLVERNMTTTPRLKIVYCL